MRLTAELTLDGLIRALRWRQHGLADEGGDSYDAARRRAQDRRPSGQQNEEAADGSARN